jgi:hypothetical protein
MPSMLLRRDVMVGFFGFRTASAAACRLLLPECWWTLLGKAVATSCCECTDDAVETGADAPGEAAGFEDAPGEGLLAVAAMVVAFSCAGGGSRRVGQWTVNLSAMCFVRRRCLAG